MIAKLLIANRGEIACRIVRTARRMGIATVAVYSDADRDALHVEAADQAVRIGAAAAADSYLNAAAIIEAARDSGADAVHPGYGFLSENASFAQACTAAGLIFVGPSAEVIAAMGDKARAKTIAQEAGVPVVPGYAGEDQSPQRLAAEAARIGFPLMIKAAAGGGGRGMRRVDNAGDLPAALESARREAEGAFGDGRLLLEKLIADARHIEVQVFGDREGNVVHLGERDCSVQRRHQKIVEETPSPFVDAGLRAKLTGDATTLAAAVGYVGAGTVEFVVGADGSHHFLEMNARLQVEHPVTEMVTGLDLVEWQIRIARGEKLPLQQGKIGFTGHAIEARLYAEDPYAGFLPQTGRIDRWKPPAEADRVDAGIRLGSEVGPHYDPMVAKLIVRGGNRADAVTKLRSALLGTEIAGLRTNRDFLLDLAASEAFADGAFTTGLIDRWITEEAGIVRAPRPDRRAYALAAAMLAIGEGGDWFRSSGFADHPLELEAGFGAVRTDLQFRGGKLAGILVDGEAVALEDVRIDGTEIRCRLAGGDGRAWGLRTADGGLWLGVGGRTFFFREPDRLGGRGAVADESTVVAPLAGLVRRVFVAEGDPVQAGTAIAAIEAMKMETVLAARTAATVRRIRAAQGDIVAMGQVIAELDSQPEK